MSASSLQQRLELIHLISSLSDEEEIQRLHDHFFKKSTARSGEQDSTISTKEDRTRTEVTINGLIARPYRDFIQTEKIDLEQLAREQSPTYRSDEEIEELIQKLDITDPLDELLKVIKGRK